MPSKASSSECCTHLDSQSVRLKSAILSSLARDTYTGVVCNEVRPRASWITRRFVPLLTMRVAKVWRSV